MFFVIIAFLSPLFYAIANIVECSLSNKIFKHPATMIFYISILNLAFVPLLFLFELPTVPTLSAFFCFFVLGVLDAAYLYPYYKALKVIDTSIVAALFSIGQVIIPVMTYFWLGEMLSLIQYAGFFIIIFSSVILSIKDFRIPKLNKAFYYMVLVSLILASYMVFEKYIFENYDPNWVNMVMYPKFFSTFLPFLFLLSKKKRDNIKKSFVHYKEKFVLFAANEFTCFVGLATSVYALSGLSPVFTASVSATMPIFLLFISVLLHKKFAIKGYDDLTPKLMVKKTVCFIFIILGVVMVV